MAHPSCGNRPLTRCPNQPWCGGSSTTTCCSAGLSGCRWMRRSGTRRYSQKTVTGCWRARWRPASWPPCCRNRGSRNCCRRKHFSVDGTLIEAWASMKSFRPKDGSGEPPGPGRNGERSFHGEKRGNETHASTTDPEARLYRKSRGQASRLCYMGHVLMENRSGLVVEARLTQATGTAERQAALAKIDGHRQGSRRLTLGADKAYDVTAFVEDLRRRRVTPHIAIDGHVRVTGKPRKTAIDGRTTRHPGYAISQLIRKRIEEPFGWVKTVAVLRKTRHRGVARVGWMFTIAMAAYNLIRIPKLLAPA